MQLLCTLDFNVAEAAGCNVLIDVSACRSQSDAWAELRQLTPAAGNQIFNQPFPLYLCPSARAA